MHSLPWILAASAVLAPLAFGQSSEIDYWYFPDDSGWYEFQPSTDGSKTFGGGLIGMADWLPTENQLDNWGRVKQNGDDLFYQNNSGYGPVKFWGVNIGSKALRYSDADYERIARIFSKYGYNLVRFHKIMEFGASETYTITKLDAINQERFDYFFAQLRKEGIYSNLSLMWFLKILNNADNPVGNDYQRFQSAGYLDELRTAFGEIERPNGDKIIQIDDSYIYFLSTEMQDLKIEQAVNFLDHTNPYTGKRYASDPAVAFVELLNESDAADAFKPSTLSRVPTLKNRMAFEFAQFLKFEKGYANQTALINAWGADAINYFATGAYANEFNNENLGANRVYPVGTTSELNGNIPAIDVRSRDTLEFIDKIQREFYDRFVQELRDVGYWGEVIASNWGAGASHSPSDILNFMADREYGGIIDRHHYFAQEWQTALREPGAGILIESRYQADDRPFMISEWHQDWSSPFQKEARAMVAAYGYGLHGWDAMTAFGNSDDTFHGGIAPALGYRVQHYAPHALALQTILSRQIFRGDVNESPATAIRNVNKQYVLDNKALNYQDSIAVSYYVKGISEPTPLVDQNGPYSLTVDLSGMGLQAGDTLSFRMTDAAEKAAMIDNVQIGSVTETFEGGKLPNSRSDGSFVGNGGLKWTYEKCSGYTTDGTRYAVIDGPFATLTVELASALNSITFNLRSRFNGNTQIDVTGGEASASGVEINYTDKTDERAYAVARVATRVTGGTSATPTFDTSPYLTLTPQGEEIWDAANGQLSWRAGTSEYDGDIVVDTPRTQGIIGFFDQNETISLGDIEIRLLNPGRQHVAIFATTLDRAKSTRLGNGDDVLIIALARSRNTGQAYEFNDLGWPLLDNDGNLGTIGEGPILMEPVKAKFTFKDGRNRTITKLDHDGFPDGTVWYNTTYANFQINGASHKTPYYLATVGAPPAPDFDENPPVDNDGGEGTLTIREPFDWASALSGSFSSGNANGSTGLSWAYDRALYQSSKSINGTSIILQRPMSSGVHGSLTASLPGNITGFSVNFKPRYNGGSQIRVTINGTDFNSSVITGDGTVGTLSGLINASAGDQIIIKTIGNTANKDTIIDDLELIGLGGGGGTGNQGGTAGAGTLTFDDVSGAAAAASITSADSNGTDWTFTALNGRKVEVNTTLDGPTMAAQGNGTEFTFGLATSGAFDLNRLDVFNQVWATKTYTISGTSASGPNPASVTVTLGGRSSGSVSLNWTGLTAVTIDNGGGNGRLAVDNIAVE